MRMADSRPQWSSESFLKAGTMAMADSRPRWSSASFLKARTMRMSDSRPQWSSCSFLLRARTTTMADSQLRWSSESFLKARTMIKRQLYSKDHGYGWQSTTATVIIRKLAVETTVIIGSFVLMTKIKDMSDSRSQWSSGMLLFKSRTMTTADSWTQWWSCNFFFKV